MKIRILVVDRDTIPGRRASIKKYLEDQAGLFAELKVDDRATISTDLLDDERLWGDIVFLHLENSRADELYDKIIKKAIPIVGYSGGQSITKWFKFNEKSEYFPYISTGFDFDIENFCRLWALTNKVPPLSRMKKSPMVSSVGRDMSETDTSSIVTPTYYFKIVLVLCAGYLVAHKGSGGPLAFSLPDEISRSVTSRKKETESPWWWKRALDGMTLDLASLLPEKKKIITLLQETIKGESPITEDLVGKLYQTLKRPSRN